MIDDTTYDDSESEDETADQLPAPVATGDTAADDPWLETPPAENDDDSAEKDLDDAYAPATGIILDKARVSPVSDYELGKIGRVYVEPPGFSEAVRALDEFRMVYLVGPDHAGKSAMAHYLARQRGALNPALSIYQMRCTEDASILDLFEDENCPGGSVFIMRDAFLSPGLIKHDFPLSLPTLLEILANNNQFLILTSDGDATTNRIGDGRQTVSVSPPPEHDKLLKKHLEWYSILDSWHKEAMVAAKALEHPYHFDLFAARLQRLAAKPSPDQLEVIVRNIKDPDLSVRVWFDGLNLNQRYFAMLACLCPGLSMDDLWQLYVKLIAFLKSQGIRLDSPLNYGRDDLLESVQARRTAAGAVEFNSPIFADGALAQAQQNYREQFRLVLPKFTEAIETAAMGKRPGDRERRQALTTAIGLLGQADLRWVRPHLRDLAKHVVLDVRASAAAALRRVYDQDEQQQPVAKLLREWARDNHLYVRWTAAATYSRLPRSANDWSLEALGKMAADDKKEVRDEVGWALEQVFRRAPDHVIATLNDCLAGGHPNSVQTVRRAVGRIANDRKNQADYFRETARQEAFWPLLENTIRRGGTEQAKAALALLRSWLAGRSGSGSSEKLEDAVLTMAELLGQQRHKLLKQTLDEWIAAAEPMSPLYLSAARLAQAMAYMEPLLEIDESELELDDDDLLIINDEDLGTPPAAPTATGPVTIGSNEIEWVS
jgi:hypothetical protein